MNYNALRKTFSILTVLLCPFVLTSCSNPCIKQTNSLIKKYELTNKEEQLIKATGTDKCFVFDVCINDLNIKKVDFWVDYYENGKFKDKLLSITSSLDLSNRDSNRIIFSTQKSSPTDFEEKWTFLVGSNNNYGSGNKIIKKSKLNTYSTLGSNLKYKIVPNETIILAIIAESKNTVTIPKDIFDNNPTSLKELLKNNHVYILKCKFKYATTNKFNQ